MFEFRKGVEVLFTLEDWKNVIGKKCGVIIDPMTYRTAEMFVMGADEALQRWRIEDKDNIWWAISQNISALQTFIDTLILRERLPVFDYQFTSTDEWAKAEKLLDRCNQKDDVLLHVLLEPNAYYPLKEAAINTMNAERPQLNDELRTLILPELSAFDYSWMPSLWELKGFNDSTC